MKKFSAIVLFSVVLAIGQTAKLPCSATEREHTQDIAIQPRNWDSLYAVFKKYGRCEDAISAEGFSESVARILVDRWDTLPRLGRLSVDRAFFRFVLGHIDATLDMDDVERIRKAAANSCPPGIRKVCQDIEKRASAAAAEDAEYHAKK